MGNPSLGFYRSMHRAFPGCTPVYIRVPPLSVVLLDAEKAYQYPSGNHPFEVACRVVQPVFGDKEMLWWIGVVYVQPEGCGQAAGAERLL